MTTKSIPYTGKTVRLAPITEELPQLEIPEAAPYATAVLLGIAVLLIFGACYLVALINTQAFAVLAALLVAGFIWLAFGVTE